MKVFLSSTAVDLEAYRKVADDTILRLSHESVVMERFGPLPGEPVKECERKARECDVLVCIVAHRYGFEPEPGKGSITRREVEAARVAGREVLVWIVHDEHPWSQKKEQDRLTDPTVFADPEKVAAVARSVQALQEFKTWLESTYTCEYFTTPDDLGRKIAIILPRYAPNNTARARTYTRCFMQIWVERHQSNLSAAFLGLPSVQARQVHVQLDVCLTLAGASAPESPRLLKVEDLAPLLADGPARVLLISGDGGAGKTSLAYEIGRWFLEGKPTGQVRFPVPIESGLAEGETVIKKVKAWLDDHLSDKPSLELIECLLRDRRLIPILDHISELTPAQRQRLLAGLPPGLVIATSRMNNDGWTGRPMSRIVPQSIALDRLQSFFLEYLKTINKKDLLRDDELMSAQSQLRRIVGGKPITALLAQMFIDDVIANRQKGLLAGSVPQLMLNYVRRLDTSADHSERQHNGLMIDGRRVQQALKCLALVSHCQAGGDGESAYQPREFPSALAKATLQRQVPEGMELSALQAEAMLGYLIEVRLLIHPGEDTSELRFPLDPLADYLAALAQLEVLETSDLSSGIPKAWEAFLLGLVERQERSGELERERGFLLALRDTALERRHGVPKDATDRLARLCRLKPEEERQKIVEQRARKWTWELRVPFDNERRDAINKLAAMAGSFQEAENRQAVRKVAGERLIEMLQDEKLSLVERCEVAVVLGLAGLCKPLVAVIDCSNQPQDLRRTALEAIGLPFVARTEEISQRKKKDLIVILMHWLSSEKIDLIVKNDSDWTQLDERLGLLQSASRGLQLAESANLPLLGSGPGRSVPMLTLSALSECNGLRVNSYVVKPRVWSLPLPQGEQLELVRVPAGEYLVGSARNEEGRDWYKGRRDGCKGIDVERQRTVRLESFFMVRHAVTQVQWQVVSELPKLNRDLNKAPGTHSPTDLWEAHAQPGMLPVDSISWYDCQEWIGRLNVWLVNNWRRLAGDRQGAFSPDYPPQLRLPSESQWEVACRAGTNTPFHYGDTIDAKWANFDAGCYTYGPGRNGAYRKRPGPVGFFGMVNRWGLSEMHGQHLDWCGDQWHPNPVGAGWPKDGMVWDGDDPALARIGSLQKHWRVLRGGSWFFFPSNCRSALRFSGLPDDVDPFPGVGLRPCCLLPPGP